MDAIKKITGKKKRPVVLVGTVKGKAGLRYQVEDDLGRVWFCWAEKAWSPGARVTFADSRILGPGSAKTEMSIFEV